MDWLITLVCVSSYHSIKALQSDNSTFLKSSRCSILFLNTIYMWINNIWLTLLANRLIPTVWNFKKHLLAARVNCGMRKVGADEFFKKFIFFNNTFYIILCLWMFRQFFEKSRAIFNRTPSIAFQCIQYNCIAVCFTTHVAECVIVRFVTSVLLLLVINVFVLIC